MAAMEPRRVPVAKTASPSQRRSASSPERGDSSSETESAADSHRSEPGPAERSRLQADTMPLREIIDMVRRVQARWEKMERERRHQNARKKQKKKEKARDAREKLNNLIQNTEAIARAIETEVEEAKNTAFSPVFTTLLGSYLDREKSLLRDVREKLLISKSDPAARAPLLARLDLLQADLGRDPRMVVSTVLLDLHMRRTQLIRGVVESA